MALTPIRTKNPGSSPERRMTPCCPSSRADQIAETATPLLCHRRRLPTGSLPAISRPHTALAETSEHCMNTRRRPTSSSHHRKGIPRHVGPC
jgi:hypothetical protein